MGFENNNRSFTEEDIKQLERLRNREEIFYLKKLLTKSEQIIKLQNDNDRLTKALSKIEELNGVIYCNYESEAMDYINKNTMEIHNLIQEVKNDIQKTK